MKYTFKKFKIMNFLHIKYIHVGPSYMQYVFVLQVSYQAYSPEYADIQRKITPAFRIRPN